MIFVFFTLLITLFSFYRTFLIMYATELKKERVENLCLNYFLKNKLQDKLRYSIQNNL